jgi:hypothetical protein
VDLIRARETANVTFLPKEVGVRPMPGDVVLTHSNHILSKLTRFGQLRRYPMRYAHWAHAGIAIDDRGNIAESQLPGVIYAHIDKYLLEDYYLIRPHYHPHDLAQVLDYVERNHDRGTPYSILGVSVMALNLAMGTSMGITRMGSQVCSGFVGSALERAGYDFGKPGLFMTPADLAWYFDVLGEEGTL